ncbi:MAG: DUF3618 domain-containing protein, partial [Opitutaceae bacterium]
MNPSSNDTDSLRSDIDLTRKRMDDTMDALGDRLQPRHLMDELLGFLRGNGNGADSRLKSVCDKVTNSANAAAHSVVETVKKNPVPALLIGAGVAWMIYESRRTKNFRDDNGDRSARRADDDAVRYDPDLHYDRPLQYPTRAELETGTEPGRERRSEFSEMGEGVGEKISAAGGQVREKISHAGEAARTKLGEIREQAGEKFRAVKERAGEMGQR